MPNSVRNKHYFVSLIKGIVVRVRKYLSMAHKVDNIEKDKKKNTVLLVRSPYYKIIRNCEVIVRRGNFSSVKE
jgi:C4-type Zn-finger protein